MPLDVLMRNGERCVFLKKNFRRPPRVSFTIPRLPFSLPACLPAACCMHAPSWTNHIHRHHHSRALLAPCLLPELSEVAAVSTASPRYYPLTFHLQPQSHPAQQEEGYARLFKQQKNPTKEENAPTRILTLGLSTHSSTHSASAALGPRLFEGWRRRVLVQRKPGHLSYNQDPQALRSLLVRPFSLGGGAGACVRA